uniref:ATP synthase F0 subunit 8 n=1 Tax=Cylisticus convexus TaxID=96835 RepID=A0A0G2T4L4_9CRUS|nr:ATP synthase F0 subunit 8 [Cylisticus convexus]
MPQMGPLPWVIMLAMVLSLVLIFVTMIYFLSFNLFKLKIDQNGLKVYKWQW